MFYSSSSTTNPLFNTSLGLPSFDTDDDMDDALPGFDHPPDDTLPPSTSPPPPPSPPLVRCSMRSTQGIPPPRHRDYVTYEVDSYFIPTRYPQAKDDPNWNRAMTEEVTTLRANETWVVVPRPVDRPVVGSRWFTR
ncbi:unnamed protein product [Linum trigynum]|uniref:Uncharacterized protein n=1 Tax=Linum trigynum TaxID=586398 RepID=A0AAV2DXG4_9ROSI